MHTYYAVLHLEISRSICCDIFSTYFILRDLVEGCPDSCSVYLLLSTVQNGWALIKSNPETASKKDIEDLRSLASQAVTICSSGLLD